MDKFSIIICSKNEENRIEACIRSTLTLNSDEILLVDGNSTDNTINIVKKYSQVKIISTKNSSLTQDRQVGIDAARNKLVLMIDCDHEPKKEQVRIMYEDLKANDYAIVQARLNILEKDFWTKAENFSLKITQNPGKKNKMLGCAPAFFDKEKLQNFKFDSNITKTIDDSDYFYRLSKLKNIKFGLSFAIVDCRHETGFCSYLKKFKWYGTGDAELGFKHREKIVDIFYHLLFRYNVIYVTKAIIKLRLDTSIFFFLQGTIRFFYFLKNLSKFFITKQQK
jgi:glycosyltransferase involved in cell wall biosynthesis